MIQLPSAEDFSDPIRYLRACHGVILAQVKRLEELAHEVETSGLEKCLGDGQEWSELLRFFTMRTPQHEHEEEAYLFPVVIEHLPHTGFQPSDGPVNFLISGHEVLTRRGKELLTRWREFDPSKATDDAGLKTFEAHFVAGALELASLYRDHIELEEKNVYTLANDILEPTDRLRIMKQIHLHTDNEHHMPVQSFDAPSASWPDVDYHYRRTKDAPEEDD